MAKALANETISLEDEDEIKEVHKIVRSRQANAVKSQQRIAMQYIEGVEPDIFPLKTSR